MCIRVSHFRLIFSSHSASGRDECTSHEQEKYRFHMFCTDIFFLILTFVSYNYHFEGQNYNLSEFGRYVSKRQVVRSALQAGQSWSRRAVVRSSGRGLEKDPRTVPGRRQGLRIWPARGGHPSSLAGNLTNFASQAAGNVQNPPNGQFS